MKNTSQLSLWLAVAAIVLAIGTHSYMTAHYYELQLGEVTGKSVCNIGESFNCDAVSISDFAQLFGIPIALLGALTNGILLALLTFAFFGLSQQPQRIYRYGFWLSTFVLSMSVVMGIISITQLSTYCLFCMGTYVLSFITWLGLWKFLDEPPSQHIRADFQALLSTHRAVTVSLVLIPLLGYLFHFSIIKKNDRMNISKYVPGFIQQWKAAPNVTFDQPASLVTGPSDDSALMTIVEFADFRCGHCKNAASSLEVFLASHPKVQMKFYTFPLDGECNDAIPKGNGISCRLAKAVYCTEKTSGSKNGWALHHTIFENQHEYSGTTSVKIIDEKLKSASKEYAKDFSQIQACMDSPETHQAILAQAALGEKAGVEGTPAIYINNRKINYGQNIQVLKKVYKELKSKK